MVTESQSMQCRCCGHSLSTVFIKLPAQASANYLVDESQRGDPVVQIPLNTFICDQCLLVQLEEKQEVADIFREDYVYFSSISKSWVEHAGKFAGEAIKKYELTEASFVLEVASNDGYLLQFFREKAIPCLGVDPSTDAAVSAREKGIETIVNFFNRNLAEGIQADRGPADLIICNNVLAHVPDLMDFVAGLKVALKPAGTICIEFPHLLNLMKDVQFDTIYDEHYSYFSLQVVIKFFASHGLRLYDVKELPTHGGSLRIHLCHEDFEGHVETENVSLVLGKERQFGLHDLASYTGYQEKVYAICTAFVEFCREQKNAGKKIVGYGASAKGNTFLNTCGITVDVVDYIVDDTPAKIGKFRH